MELAGDSSWQCRVWQTPFGLRVVPFLNAVQCCLVHGHSGEHDFQPQANQQAGPPFTGILRNHKKITKCKQYTDLIEIYVLSVCFPLKLIEFLRNFVNDMENGRARGANVYVFICVCEKADNNIRIV
jgi:hypothetical protein